MHYMEEIKNYIPVTEQEIQDKIVILKYIEQFQEDVLTRKNEFAHFSSSSMIFNQTKDKVLMIYHNIYQSWSWTGGHADGDEDMFQVALKEAKEETGLKNLSPLTDKLIALDILPVWGHTKNGSYVSSHLHLNTSYLFMADEQEPIEIKPDENSDIKWIPINLLDDYVSEPELLPVYKRIIAKALI